MWYQFAEKKQENSWGYHLIIDASGCNENIKEKQKIVEFIEELVPAIDMIAVGEPLIKYLLSDQPNAGYSLMQLIETSSITCHFIEPSFDLYFDCFSCKDFDISIVVDILKKYFGCGKIRKRFLNRDADQ